MVIIFPNRFGKIVTIINIKINRFYALRSLLNPIINILFLRWEKVAPYRTVIPYAQNGENDHSKRCMAITKGEKAPV